MTDDPLYSLHLTDRTTTPLAGATVAAAAELLGLSAAERIRLHALVEELLESILMDSFAGEDALDIDVTVERRPGAMAVVVQDRGAPSEFAAGAAPPRITDLVRLGFADGMEFRNEGLKGNRAVLVKQLHYASLGEDATFIRDTAEADAAGEAEIALDDNGEAILDIRAMTPDDVVEVARLFYRVYGYSAYYAAAVYEPEKLAEFVRAGTHIGTIAITSSGRIVGHLATKVATPGSTTGLIGLLAVDPAFRRHHIGMRVGIAHITRLLELGFIGQFTEAVTVHEGSQRLALRSGGHECGMQLAAQSGSLDFRGFDVSAERRKSVLLFYGAINTTPERTSHVPPGYVELVTRIYQEGNLPRTVQSDMHRDLLEDLPEHSVFRLGLRSEANLGVVIVESYGRDFVSALQTRMAEIQLNRFELIWVYLPLNNPLTSYFGSGLQEIGLSFAGIYPEYKDGDALLLQSLNNVEVDLSETAIVSDFGRYLADAVVADWRKAEQTIAQRSRSRAAMAWIYEAMA